MEHTLTCVLVLLSTADSVNLTFHTPGTFTSAIRNSQQLVVHQRLTVPPSIVDQSVVRRWGRWRRCGSRPVNAPAAWLGWRQR